ncbi:protein CHUP1, chloroplastic-like [Nymphaea colorata]|nr:protein CHUP1, chloroplastic-like [Nymphaea colorata]
MFFPGGGFQMEKTELINPTVLKATFSIAFSLVGCFLYQRSKRNVFPSSSSSSSSSSPSSPLPSLSPSSSDGSTEENYITSSEYNESDSSHESDPQEALLERVSCLFLKVEAMEADHLRRLESLVGNCPTVEELSEARARIMVLEHVIRSRSKKKERLPRLRPRAVILQSRVAVKSRNEREMRRKFSEIRELKDEVAELRLTNVKLQGEKAELVKKLSTLESLTSSMAQRHLEAETAMEKYAKRLRITNENLLKQIEQLQMVHSPDIGEVIYLRWSNACLRYELIRKQEEEKKRMWEIEEKEKEGTVEYEEADDKSTSVDIGDDSSTVEMGDIPLHVEPKSQPNITKRKFCHKLKRWAKGSGNRFHT